MSSTAGGYRGKGNMLLSRFNVAVGDQVTVATMEGEISGVIMPRYESAGDEHLVIKLRSGYNIGIDIAKVNSIAKIARHVSSPAAAISDIPVTGSLPPVILLSTGGTIASKIDYRTGGVHPALTASELYESVPELGSYASIDAEVLFSEYSENITPNHWSSIAKKVGEVVENGKFRGVVVSHGTDTMHYTASALSFALQNVPIPIVLVGSQRSSDRPSSDASLNLAGAVIFAAKSNAGGVFVVMHDGTSDDVVACHRGTRVRKNHTSRRDAFESIDSNPIAHVKNGLVEFTNGHDLLPKGNFLVAPDFDNKVVLLKYFPGFNPELIEDAVARGTRAIILEGTGLGHVSRSCFPALSKSIKSGVMVCMTSQCIWGRVNMNVYDTGRDLLEIGIIPLSDMLSETALAKAMWVLANTKDIEEAKIHMKKNIAGEIIDSISL